MKRFLFLIGIVGFLQVVENQPSMIKRMNQILC